MTTRRTFDRDLTAILDDLYVAGTPDYRDDLVRQTAVTRQRPAWTFPERWLPVDLVMQRVPIVRGPLRAAAILALIALLIAAALFIAVGTKQKLPPLFGPARNGPLAAIVNGDIVVRDTINSTVTRVLIGGDVEPPQGFNADGTKIAFGRSVDHIRYLFVANSDGSGVRRLMDEALISDWETWSPDGRSLGVITSIRGVSTLRIVPVDGSAARDVPLPGLFPTTVQFRPPEGRELVIRARDEAGIVDLYTVGIDGSGLKRLHLTSAKLFGEDWDLADPSYTPKGDRIMFSTVVHDPVTAIDHFRIHTVRPDGTDERELPGPEDPSVNEAWPSFSPDGTQILVQRFTFDPPTGWIGLLPADGSGRGRSLGPQVANGEGSNMQQDWSPDGKTILLRFNEDHFYTVDPKTGAATLIDWKVTEAPAWMRLAVD
jgi:hypothetical protein